MEMTTSRRTKRRKKQTSSSDDVWLRAAKAMGWPTPDVVAEWEVVPRPWDGQQTPSEAVAKCEGA